MHSALVTQAFILPTAHDGQLCTQAFDVAAYSSGQGEPEQAEPGQGEPQQGSPGSYVTSLVDVGDESHGGTASSIVRVDGATGSVREVDVTGAFDCTAAGGAAGTVQCGVGTLTGVAPAPVEHTLLLLLRRGMYELYSRGPVLLERGTFA